MALKNILRLAFVVDSDETGLSKTPIIIGVILVYFAVIFTQAIYKSSFVSIFGFTLAMALHLLMYLFFDRIFKNRYWLYFVVQGVIILNCVVIMPEGYEVIFLGLIPILIFQSIVVYSNTIKAIVASSFFYCIFCGTIVTLDGWRYLIKYIPILMLINTAIRAYSAIFFKQVKARIETQKVLKELELAYEKVEELTLANERQRMARDLHDTLSQGLAGVIMQLEAVDANLNKGKINRAQEIVKKSMEHARKTLADSRLVIDDLRFKTNEEIDFTKKIENEILAFKAVSNIPVSADIKIKSYISYNKIKHIIYIVREGLNNIAKHSKAKTALIKIMGTEDEIKINIIDDGIGFEVSNLDKSYGHYGLLGITERVHAIGGEIEIKSKKRSGTNVCVAIPIKKGKINGNE